ncbi:hypothetical protein CVT24_012670 [Panaeolus cyanescens]|uniref:Uncharacterized protein n=1 Tax=Panaeolus cyanescens TaxID=181874 RepID=A0A409YKA4_9AGAR|nr:hypothetical protein CVT24_012670 [Panaeolus cyanescens]
MATSPPWLEGWATSYLPATPSPPASPPALFFEGSSSPYRPHPPTKMMNTWHSWDAVPVNMLPITPPNTPVIPFQQVERSPPHTNIGHETPTINPHTAYQAALKLYSRSMEQDSMPPWYGNGPLYDEDEREYEIITCCTDYLLELPAHISRSEHVCPVVSPHPTHVRYLPGPESPRMDGFYTPRTSPFSLSGLTAGAPRSSGRAHAGGAADAEDDGWGGSGNESDDVISADSRSRPLKRKRRIPLSRSSPYRTESVERRLQDYDADAWTFPSPTPPTRFGRTQSDEDVVRILESRGDDNFIRGGDEERRAIRDFRRMMEMARESSRRFALGETWDDVFFVGPSPPSP